MVAALIGDLSLRRPKAGRWCTMCRPFGPDHAAGAGGTSEPVRAAAFMLEEV